MARIGDRIDWASGLYAVQNNLKLSVHVGGKSALLLQGHGHFIPLGKGWPLTLFGRPGTKLPAWFLGQDWDVRLRFVISSLFESIPETALTESSRGTFSIRLSSPERAMMELLSLVPQKEAIDEAKLIMDGLITLRPDVVQQLLERCSSVKVKRLFLFLAEECNHAWVKNLDLSKIDLGKGKRSIEKGGVFRSKYGITVPRSVLHTSKENIP